MIKKPPSPWFRFSLRMLFVVVTVVAVGAFLWQRSRYFDEQAHHHLRSIRLIKGKSISIQGDAAFAAYCERMEQSIGYHRTMMERYRRAARFPWLSVAKESRPHAPREEFRLAERDVY